MMEDESKTDLAESSLALEGQDGFIVPPRRWDELFVGSGVGEIGGLGSFTLEDVMRLGEVSREGEDERVVALEVWRVSAHLPFLWRKASVVAASTCVRVRSYVRCRRRGSRNGWAERQGTLLSFFSFPSATLNITYILHWVICPWLSHVFIRFIGHRALTSKGDKPVPIRG